MSSNEMTMQGSYKAKNFVNNYLMEDLPRRLVVYRNEWNLDDENLPEPLKYLVYEPVALDTWPTLITVAISMNGLRREGYNKYNDPVYNVDYSMRTYIWVKDEDSEQCTAKRDRLVTVVRSALLDSPCLTSHADPQDFGALIEESSIREEYSDLTLIKGERVMAGAYVAYTLGIEEIVKRFAVYESVNGITFENEVNPLLPLLKDL
jgi:hypothetical protein